MIHFAKIALYIFSILSIISIIQRKALLGACRRNFIACVFAAPIILILVLFALFIVISPVLGVDVGTRGAYGDSFGIITSLFTGLGFAGLTITLIIQQIQIGKQEAEFQWTKDESAAERYEATLYKLLDMYKKSVDSVIIKDGGSNIVGLDAIGLANNRVSRTLRKNMATRIPGDIARRLGKDVLTARDKAILTQIFSRNIELICGSFCYQGRLIKSFLVLMHHLEDRRPQRFGEAEMKYPRMMIQSQLTHLEVTYFFYLGLAFREEDLIRRALRSSGLFAAFPTICHYEAHRYMYIYLWNYDPKTDQAAKQNDVSDVNVTEAWEVVDDNQDENSQP